MNDLNPSTSKVDYNSVASNSGKQDWNDYSPVILKVPLSKPLMINIPSDTVQVIIIFVCYTFCQGW